MYTQTQQQPLNSPFTMKSTGKDVMRNIDLKGKTVIITGGYSGIGLEVTKYLAKAGAKVYVLARTLDKAQKNVGNLPNAVIQQLDLMNPESIDHFASDFIAEKQPLHLLIECAGIMFAPLKRDSRGNESHFSTNYLGHFQLVQRLYPALKAAGHSRVVVVTSRAQSWGGIDLADINFNQRDYDPRIAYAQSKIADILFAVALDKRAHQDGIRSFAVHPGLVPGTELGRFVMKHESLQKISAFVLNNLQATRLISVKNSLQARFHHEQEFDYFKTVNQGAASILWAATSPLLDNNGGVFVEDSNIGIAVSADSKSKFGVRPWSVDSLLADKLWILGEKLIETRQ